MIKRFILLTVLVLTAGVSKAQKAGEMVDGIEAIIGKNVILYSDFQKGLMQYQAQGVSLDERMRCKIFEDLLIEKLLIHQADIDSLEVGEDEINGNVDQRLQMLVSRVGSMQELEKFYNKTEEELKDEMHDIIKDQLKAQRMQQSIIDNVDVTPEEVREFFNSIPSDQVPTFGTEVVLAHVMKKPILSQETKDATIAKLNSIRNDILEYGSSFKTKAILYSEDPGSASKGGAYYGVRKGQFVKAFEEAAFNLQEGEISEPVETEFGFHIIQLIKRKGEELDLRHILIKPIIKDEDLRETSTTLDSLKAKIIRGELTFSEAAKEFSDDETTRFNDGVMINPASGDGHFELNQLPKELYYKVDNMNVGDISEVIYQQTERGEKQFSIVKLIERIAPHKADLSKDFPKIKQMALAAKKERISVEWIKNHMDNVYIKINPKYKSCTFLNPWFDYSQE